MKRSFKDYLLLLLLLLFIVGLLSACILNSCVPTLRTHLWTAPEKVDWLNDYKRDIELLLEYEGKEYKMRATIDCKYIKNGAIGIGGIEPDYAKIRNFVTIWETSITNNKLTLASGEELVMRNFFKGREERFYNDEYIEEFEKKKRERSYDKKTGYYSKREKVPYKNYTVAFAGYLRVIGVDDKDRSFIRNIYKKLKIYKFKISKRY